MIMNVKFSVVTIFLHDHSLQFDYRVLHRGCPNKSDAARPVLVFTFAKNWYRVGCRIRPLWNH